MRRGINKGGFTLGGIPVHIASYEPKGITVNLFDRPADFGQVLPSLLARARTKKRWVVLCYPAAWSRKLRKTARDIAGGLKRGRNYWPSA